MKLPELGEGAVVGAGGTFYRFAMCDAEGEPGKLLKMPTPTSRQEFFGQTARLFLGAAEKGATWGFLGVPGLADVEVDADGIVTQHVEVTNIPALHERVDPVAEMAAADPAFGRLLGSGFIYLSGNDAKLAALAGAKLFGTSDTTPKKKYNVIADIIDGTGTGGGLARRDKRFPGLNLFHPDEGLWEVGHGPETLAYPTRTFEATISGTRLEKYCHEGEQPKDLDSNDPIWDEVAHGLGSLAVNFGIYGGAELVVLSGGVNIRRQKDYRDELERLLDRFERSRNPMANRVPDIQYVPVEMVDTYELYGARGAVLSHLTRRAIDQLVYKA